MLAFSLAMMPLSAQSTDFATRYAERVLDCDWTPRLIAAGGTRPSLDITGGRYDDLAVLLHERLPASVIAPKLGWSEAELDVRLQTMAEAELARRDSALGWLPTVMVMAAGDVARYLPVDAAMIAESASLVTDYVPEVRRQYDRTSMAGEVPFAAASLLVLSNVLLDNGQINYVEARVLEAERPLRGGGRYYYSVQERTGPREPFGIYGNLVRPYGKAVAGVYGNRRSRNALNFITLDAAGIELHFDTRPDDADAFKASALAW